MNIYIIISGSFLILLAVAIYVIVNVLKKYKKIEEKHVNFVSEMYQELEKIRAKKEEIDSENYFEYDENMQYVYGVLDNLIVSIMKKFNDYVKKE